MATAVKEKQPTMEVAPVQEKEKHVYEYDVHLDGESAAARVVRMVEEGKRVLEIGAGPGSITRHLSGHRKCKVVALELDETALKKLSAVCDKAYQANLNDPHWPEVISEEAAFDVVVAADVLEHLYDPYTVLKQMRWLLAKNGYVVLSIPHVGHAAIHACLYDEDFEYRDWGLLDRTHIRFFGIKNIERLCEQAGLKIVQAEFVVLPPEQTEFAAAWNNLPQQTRKAIQANPFHQVYQVVLKAVPAETSDPSVILMDQVGRVKMEYRSKTYYRVRGLIKRLIPQRFHTSMYRVSRAIGV